MEKGKHATSKKENIKQKAKKQIISRLIILLLCLICIIVIIQTQNANEEVSASQGRSVEEAEKENKEEGQGEENSEENNGEGDNEEKQKEPVVPTEDEEIKNLISEIKTANNLTTNNFAFFYYNPETQKYYFDNQDKYFTAASTVKVPVAMLYYDKIKKRRTNSRKQITIHKRRL